MLNTNLVNNKTIFFIKNNTVFNTTLNKNLIKILNNISLISIYFIEKLVLEYVYKNLVRDFQKSNKQFNYILVIQIALLIAFI